MKISKSKKAVSPDDDIDAIKSDVANFASSIGLSSAPSTDSGFNDSDFRKKGPLNPRTPPPQLNDKNKKPPQPRPPARKQQQLQKQEQNKKGKGNVFDGSGGKSFQPKYKHLPKLPLMRAKDLSGQWYSDLVELEARVLGEGGKSVGANDLEVVKKLEPEKRELAERLLEQFSQDYEGSRAKTGDMKMVAAAQRSGTASDKVAAFTCSVEDNPIANLRALDALLGMVTSKVGKRHALTGFEALRDLFTLRLLPDRKLKTLVQRPINHLPETKDGYSLLLFWYWEDVLKLRYERFVGALEDASRDMLPILKDKALKTIYALLTSKSEQERRLLSMLVNKLGDPERKAASGAGYHLQCILSAHPNMKVVVIEEVDSFLFRPHLGMRAKYHAVNFLSQIFINRKGDGPKVAKRLVDVYFALFKVLMTEPTRGNKSDEKAKEFKKKNGIKNIKEVASGEADVEMDSRLLSALLTGVNRAFPYIGTDDADDLIIAETPILFKLVHSENFNVGVQALMLLYQISSKNQIASDRFYRALYSMLLVPAVQNFSKPEMFLGLLFKAMKNDLNIRRLASFAKRLLQVAIQQPPQFACGCLFILSEVLKAKPPLWSMMLQKESIDEEFEHFEDIIEDSVVVNSSMSNPETLVSKNDNIDNYMMDLGGIVSEGDYKDEQKLGIEGGKDSKDKKFVKDDASVVNPEVVYDHEVGQPRTLKTGLSLPGGYDPRHRDPSYCNADRTSWWELTTLASHVHPSVSTMARTLLYGTNITYNGDPLKDLSLSAFLDKFMEKKPKPNRRADGTWHGGSQIAPAKKIDIGDHLIGAELLSLDAEDVPPEDLVFHTFYVNKMNTAKKSKKKKKKVLGVETTEEELFGGSDSDESDIDEAEDGFASKGNDVIDDDYDYDDLDQAADDDEDLLGSGSDEEAGPLEESLDGVSISSDDDDAVLEDGDVVKSKLDRKKKNKRKFVERSGASPFASLEEYEHLLEDSTAKKVSKREKSGPHRKKKQRKSAD